MRRDLILIRPAGAWLARLLVDHQGGEGAVLASSSTILGYVVEYMPELVPQVDALEVQSHAKVTVGEEGPACRGDDEGCTGLGGPLSSFL
jgi:hypothetical protein